METTTGDGSEFDGIDNTHLVGDLCFVNHYRERYWYIAGALCLFAPPAGIFLLVYFLSSGIHTDGEAVDVDLRDE